MSGVHVCTCGDCEVEAYDDRCKYELMMLALGRAIEMRWGQKQLQYVLIKALELQLEGIEGDTLVNDKQNNHDSVIAESRAIADRHRLRALERQLAAIRTEIGTLAEELDLADHAVARVVAQNLREL